MRGSYRRVEHTVRTIRYEMEAPVELKEIGIACTWVAQQFERLNGRMPTCDNDYWLEPMDEAVAFVFVVHERVTDDEPSARPRSCPTCHSPGMPRRIPGIEDPVTRACTDTWHDPAVAGRATTPEVARPRSCPTCHSPVQVRLGPFDDQTCTDSWHEAPGEAKS